MKMSAAEEDRITVWGNTARKRPKGKSVKRGTRSWRGGAKQSLS